MKRIEAVIKLSKLYVVKDALAKIGIDEITVCEVKGFSWQNKHFETYRGGEFTVDFLPRIKIDLVVLEQNAERVVKIIIKSVNSGKTGDDKVFISDVEEARRALAI